MKISYAIMVCNEREEIEILVNHLRNLIDEEDEIVILGDEENVTEEVISYLDSIKNIAKIDYHPLNKNFAAQKNYLFDMCNGDYIFNIDADETPSESLIKIIKKILKLNEDIEIIAVPRINTLDEYDEDYILREMRWNLNENGWINFPDYQWRIAKNVKHIKWIGNVHERLIGNENQTSALPPEEYFCLYHHKKLERQKKQNEFYKEIVK